MVKYVEDEVKLLDSYKKFLMNGKGVMIFYKGDGKGIGINSQKGEYIGYDKEDVTLCLKRYEA